MEVFMSSLKEVAQLANVSVATVSRVLNNDTKVKLETRKKVLRVIEEIDYKPNLLAKNLRKQRSNAVSIIVPTMANPFFAEIVRGAQAAINDNGYNAIIGTTEFDEKQLDVYVDLLKTNIVEGAIFVSLNIKENVLKELINEYPIVLCNEYFDELNVACVSIDNEKAGNEATMNLLKRGRKNIAYIRGKYNTTSVLGRLLGYKRALKDNGIEYNSKWVVKGSNNFCELQQIIKNIFENEKNIDGLIVHSDIQASISMKAIKELGLRIPEDVAIISFDGTIISKITDPSLTTISQPLFDLGYTSVELLIEKLKKNNNVVNKKVILPYRLDKRET
jgi:DNA-binding LacI/PurR family transcriptional regulator